MLDTYEGSAAMAESEERIGAPVADYAAGQQAPASAIQSAFENLENVVTHNLEYPDARVKLGADDAQVLMEDFIAGSPEVNKPMTEDGRIKTFSEMSDEEIMVRLPDYLASGMSSSGINNAMIEEAQAVMAEACMSEEELEASPDPRTPRGRELRDRKLLELAREAHGEMSERFDSERKRLNKEQQEFLARQEIDLGDGRSASALDIVNSMDKMLDNWDRSFDDMVDQGIAEPQDKDKLKTAMTKYRNMMAGTNLSAAEKQKLREKMIASGEITQEQMNYADAQAEKEKSRSWGREAKQDQQIGKQQVSVEAGASAFAEEESPAVKTSVTPSFSTVAPSGINTEVKLTETYNAKATAEAANDPKQPTTPAIASAPKAPAQAVSGEMGFG